MPQRLKYLILTATLLRMIVAAVVEFGNDEAYYFLYALDLQPNYFDHPPGVGLLIRLTTLNLLLTHEFFVRLGAILCAGVGTWLAYRLGTQLKNEQTGWFAAVLYNASLYTSLIAGTFIIPDSPQVVLWLASLVVMHRIVMIPVEAAVPIRDWLLFGMVSGFTILCKVHGVFLWFGLGLFLVLYQPTRLKATGLYAAAIVTAIIISPILIWNIQNEFITFRFHGSRVDINGAWIHVDYFVQTVLGQLLYSNPVNSALLIFSLWRLRTINFLQQDSARFILINGAPIVIVVTLMSIFNPMLPHWSGPGFMVLSFLAAAFLDEKAANGARHRIDRILKGTLIAMGSLLIVSLLVIQVYPGTFGSKNKKEFGDNDFTLDLYGWKKFSNEFQTWLHQQEKEGKIASGLPIVSNKWFPGAHVDYYVARPLQKPLIGVGRITDLHQYYWLNKERPALQRGDHALCIVPSNYHMVLEESYYQNFNSIELLNVFYSFRGGQMARYFTVYLLKDYKGNDEVHQELVKSKKPK